MNAAFGAVSEDGRGTPPFDVTQSGSGPSALVANQPAGNTGGVTSSKFATIATGCEQGLWHEGVDLGAAPPTKLPIDMAISSWPAVDRVLVIACEEPVSSNAAIAAAVEKPMQTTFRNRIRPSERFGVCISGAACNQRFTQIRSGTSMPVFRNRHSRRPTRVKSLCARPR